MTLYKYLLTLWAEVTTWFIKANCPGKYNSLVFKMVVCWVRRRYG